MKKLLLCICVALLVVSCGKKEVKQVSNDSKISTEAFGLAEKIRDAFVKKDIVTIQQLSTENGYRDIMSGRKGYDAVELTFTPRWVELDKEQVTLNITWKSKWTAAGKAVADRGMAVFVLEGKPMKLTKILRSNPFAFPEQ